MKKIKFILASIIAFLFVGCTNSDNYSTPDTSGDCEQLTTTKTVQDVATSATNNVQQFSTTIDDILEAYVTSSDEGGNFYKSISMVSVDGTKGFSVPVDDYNLYTKFEPGRKVYIKLKGRYYYNNSATSSLEIGDLLDNGEPLADEVGRLSLVEYQNVIRKSCVKVDENDIKNVMTISQAKNNANLNKLIEFDAVQFSDANVGKTYFDSNNQIGGATNNILVDATGNSIIVRVSEFAGFAVNTIPNGNGKVRGVLTKFGSDFQLMIRTVYDVNLSNPRVDYYPPIVGNANVFDATLNENFSSYATNLSNFPKYINDADLGSRYWQVKSFSSNKYIEMSSFAGSGNPGVPSKTFFMVPVDFSAANSMTFKEEMRFYRGDIALKVYYIKSSDYVAGSVVDRSKLADITSSFNITYPGIGLSENSFNTAGTYNIPSTLTGNGYFVFEYVGTETLTTTVQIDDIVIN